MATEATPPFAQLRCADHDRELVAQVLNNAYAEGRLNFDEHADRIAAAYDAKTFGQLEQLTADLLPRQHVPTPPPPLPPAALPRADAPAPMAGLFTGGSAVLSSFRPGRLDVVAREVHLNAWLGDVKLDLVGATFEDRHTRINVGGMMGEIKIRVPEGVSVNLNGVTNVLAESKSDGVVPHPDGITLTLVGTVIMSEVTVLGPATKKQRRYGRF